MSEQPNINTRKRRVVHFEEDSEIRSVKRRLIELHDVPVASQMTDSEKSASWRQSLDHRATSSEVKSVVQSCRSEPSKVGDLNSSYFTYAEALASTYHLCDGDDSNEQFLPLEQIFLLGMYHSERRGLESIINPTLGFHRLQKRRAAIRGVLSVQKKLRSAGKSQSDMAEDLGMVSEFLSKPAAQFARALGTSDGALALFEYSSCSASPVHAVKTTQRRLEKCSPSLPSSLIAAALSKRPAARGAIINSPVA